MVETTLGKFLIHLTVKSEKQVPFLQISDEALVKFPSFII